MVTVVVKYMYVRTYLPVHTTTLIYCLGLFSVAYEKILLSWQWLEGFTILCTSYGVIIACGHLTNMQGCHGNCSGGFNVCADYQG